MGQVSDRCQVCEHPLAMGRCWRLTCPMNGGNERTMKLVRKDEEERTLL
jgi:hypothetical protein